MSEEKKPSSGIRTAKGLLVWALVLVAMAAIALGDAEPAPVEVDGAESVVSETTASTEPEIVVARATGTVAASATETVAGDAATSTEPDPVAVGGKIQSIAFKKDMRIQDALLFLQERYQKNIVPSAKVDGAINVVNLRDVTFEQAMDAILGRDFAIETKGNIIKVYTAAEYKAIREDPERMAYEIFTLYYITAVEAKKMLMPILSENAKIEVTSAAETTFPTGESISSTVGGADSTAMNDTIIVHDYPEKVEEAGKLLKRLDIRPKQVLIEATIMDVLLTEDMQFGIDWSNMNTAVTGLGNIVRGSDYIKSSNTNQVDKTGGLTFGFAEGNVAGFIRAVETVTDVTILANPKILAVNKQLGQVYIGTKLGYKSGSITTQTSTTEQTEFLDSGTKLSFRPFIGNDGYIRMDIHPKDSSAELNAEKVPDETSAELLTNILVKNGQTIVIGGLFRDKISAKRTQVPVLGDIPLIGLLFRGKADQIERHEVVVLLTPTIIEDPDQADGDRRADDVRRKREGALDELQLTGRGKIAEEYYVEAVRCYIRKDATAAMENIRRALRLRPAYLEAIRLKERILRETSPEEAAMLDRIILEDIDRKEAPKWLRR